MHIITGCMFSGKTEKLISLVKAERYAGRPVICFKPSRDNRYSGGFLVSHEIAAAVERVNEKLGEITPDPDLYCEIAEIVAQGVYSSGEICHQVSTVDELESAVGSAPPGSGIAFDEFQFLEPASPFIEYIETVYQAGRRVFIAGLDLDSRGVPFGPMPEMLARASKVTKLFARCMVCGEKANRSFRLEEGGDQVKVGGASDYEPRCMKHWSPR